jgi:large subunit ribosomal protein L33
MAARCAGTFSAAEADRTVVPDAQNSQEIDSFPLNGPESRAYLAAKTLTLGAQKLGCAANAPPIAGAPIHHHQRFLNMAKAVTIKVKLVSSADTGFYYVAKKNSRTMTDKLVKKKYDPVARKHVEFRESKIK